MGEIVISIKNISKSFATQCVLDDVSIDVQSGKIYGIVGRNGSGKTVLMKCICGFLVPDKGEIQVFGKTIGKDVHFPERTGFIIENAGFIPRKSGRKNLEYIASMLNIADSERIRTCMELVGLDYDSRKKVQEYSLGMKRRLSIAQAVMENPELLILDEPMNGLDNEGVSKMREFFLFLKKEGKTIVLISHNREDINVLCDEVYEMDCGRLSPIDK